MIVPALVTLALTAHQGLSPLISISYIIAIAAAGWIGGIGPGVLAAAITLPVIVLSASGGRTILPPRIDVAAECVLFLVGIMSGTIARARHRAEDVLRRSNLELEEKVVARTADLEHARLSLQITLASIGDAVIATDRSGCITFLNAMAESLTGWPQEEACGRHVGEVFIIVNESTREAAPDPVAKVLRTGAISGLANHTVLLSRSGREIPIDDSAAPIRDERHEVAGVVLTFRDITDRRKSERLAEQGRLRLEQTNHELQQFAYAASHDLREPLRNVTIYSQLLKQQYGDRLDSNADQFISFIVNGTRRMELLVKDLLAYTQASNIDASAISPTDANAALENVIASLKSSIDMSGAHVTGDPLPKVPMDRVHLEQLLQNLVGNAIKYRGPVPPSIHVSARRNEDGWIFCVADNGIGIDPQYREKIFGLFKRLHTTEQYEGTGIGLAICEKIVQRYGGQIAVESELGRGSQFYFSVPAPERIH